MKLFGEPGTKFCPAVCLKNRNTYLQKQKKVDRKTYEKLEFLGTESDLNGGKVVSKQTNHGT